VHCLSLLSPTYSRPTPLRPSGAQRSTPVLEPFTGEIVADHVLVAPGETSIVDEHYGSSWPDNPRRAPRAKTEEEKPLMLGRAK
jgi:hypothetical protein